MIMIEYLDAHVISQKEKGAGSEEYIWVFPINQWRKILKESSINDILSHLRRNRIKGINVITSYGIKKIRIWL